MTSVNTDSSFYRATSAFLDPLRAPGGASKRRKIPVFAALRISASACLFATSDHHAAHGIRAVWRLRVRGLYLSMDALLRTLNCLTDLGFFDSTFQSLEHAMSCAVELDVGLPRPLDLLIYCTDFIPTPQPAFIPADWLGGYSSGLGSLTLDTLQAAGASVDCAIHLLACLGLHYSDRFLQTAVIARSSYAAALRHLEGLTYKYLSSNGDDSEWLDDIRLCIDFSALWVTLHGSDHRLRVGMLHFDKRYITHLYALEFSSGSTRADALGLYMRDHILSFIWAFHYISLICANESVSPPVYSSLSSLISLYNPAVVDVTLNSLQGLEVHLKTRSGLVVEAFSKHGALTSTVAALLRLGHSHISVSDSTTPAEASTTDTTAAPLKGQRRVAALSTPVFVEASRRLEKRLAASTRSPLKICTLIFQLRGKKASALMLQVAYNVPLRAALNEMTTDLVAYLHPQPVNLAGSSTINPSKPHLAFYMGQVFNSDAAGAYSLHPTLAAASAPADFVHAVLSMQLDTPAFDFVYLGVFFMAAREETTPIYHSFDEYMCDEKTMHEAQRNGMKMVCSLGWDASPVSGLTFSAFMQTLIDAVDIMGRLTDTTMYETQHKLIIAAYHEGLREASSAALAFLRSVPSTKRGDFGAFIPDTELPALRRLRAVQQISVAQQLTILSLTPMDQRRPVSALDHIERSQTGVKRARSSLGSTPLTLVGGGSGSGVLSAAQRALLGTKAASINWSSSKRSFWFGRSNDYFVCSVIEGMCPGLCHPFAMSNAVGDEALQFCPADHQVPPGVGAHALPSDIAAIRAAAKRRYYAPAAPTGASAVQEVDAEAPAAAILPVAPPAAPKGKGKQGKGGRGGKGGGKGRPFQQR